MSWFDKTRTIKLSGRQGFDNRCLDCRQRLSLLTSEEYGVFMLLREGFTKKECSQRLGLKSRQVKNLAKSVFNKLCVSSLAELIVNYREIS
ncbi:MAG TPA: LuxR C-terminal-related transcriptional regulator [Candidatus Avimonas sp.]|jgi:DNA-binding NarL/FixJ family response regulator|nr:hypothetical protein [Clostridiales bacterium]HOB37188.1 LuxR C-terminal-related transcriptional regulator [Candidatus Avimonas sp.]HPU59010.1 LuxR C-terminal-related transcriptional regulator [Candidatus Avimonas sp.]HQA16595.1 LuxR C-terminal-related transcriptional regulator [Candidatus Avimonas sp.]HQD38638.1 LuxR C-terminal-related transcriptional regulator [Candidatus Avimonas sp.]